MTVDPTTLPPPPRPLTRRAALRAWTEPTVRLWWLVALAIVAAVGIYAVDRQVARLGENRLIAEGVPVTGKVLSNAYHSMPGQTADATDETTISFPWKGSVVTNNGFLSRSTVIGAPLPIHVDPRDPSRWTDQTEPTPLLRSVFVGLMLLPIVPVLLAIASLIRLSLLRTYRFGRVATAVVSDRRQVPIAPLSSAVRCSLQGGADRRIYTVYVPRGAPPLAKGDTLEVLVAPRPGRPVAALWFT